MYNDTVTGTGNVLYEIEFNYFVGSKSDSEIVKTNYHKKDV